MVEKMTAVWLIILTIMVCAAVPALLIWITTTPASMLVGLEKIGALYGIAQAH
jgi:hypothetical protein